jgi:hypothetical protein
MKKVKILFMTLMIGAVSTIGLAQEWTPNPAAVSDNISRDGNVTIGTTTSATSTLPKLSVRAMLPAGPPNGLAASFISSYSGSIYQLNVCKYSSSGPLFFEAIDPTYGTTFKVYSNGATVIGTSASGTDATNMLVVNSGNVVIGNVLSPAGYKLYVEKGILTERLKVAVSTSSNWSDYVFNKDYKLLSLGEVEAYVNKNKHLPGVPSAEEVVKDGIDMATMDAKLLEKIEELTLYMIAQQKQMEEIQKENGKLKERVQLLENK